MNSSNLKRIILAISIILFYTLEKGSTEDAGLTESQDTFESRMQFVKERFVHQSRETWKRIFSTVQNILRPDAIDHTQLLAALLPPKVDTSFVVCLLEHMNNTEVQNINVLVLDFVNFTHVNVQLNSLNNTNPNMAVLLLFHVSQEIREKLEWEYNQSASIFNKVLEELSENGADWKDTATLKEIVRDSIILLDTGDQDKCKETEESNQDDQDDDHQELLDQINLLNIAQFIITFDMIGILVILCIMLFIMYQLMQKLDKVLATQRYQNSQTVKNLLCKNSEKQTHGKISKIMEI